MVKVIRFYQVVLSPFKPSSCRFYPSCSSYSIQAFKRYSIGRAFYLTVRRVLKCHPFHPGGYDPLP